MASSDQMIDREKPTVSLIKSPALTKKYAVSTVIAPPIGLAYIAGTLLDSGIACQIVDSTGENLDQLLPLDFTDGYSIGLSMEEIVDAIDPGADIIGMSCMFSSSWPYDHRLIKKIKLRFPHASIVVGGEHATACAEYILSKCPEVDICVKGEGESVFLELVKALRGGGDLSIVPGLVYRDNGSVEHSPPPVRIQNVDLIPLPAWDLVPLENYFQRGLGHGVMSARNMPLMATRGCPYQCTFCSSPKMWTTQWMARDMSAVIDEMEFYIAKYSAENFDLYDLTAIIRKDWIVEFANEILRRGLNITYQLPSGTRTEAIDAEVVDLLYRSGCRQMNYAPESGSPDTLKRIKKKVKLPRLQESLRSAYRRGLSVMVNIIFFPDDSRRDVLLTFKFMLKCSWLGLHDITFVPFVPYPGTELYDKLVKEGGLPPMSEEYFVSLLTHSDLSSIQSYNPRFTARQVQIIRMLFLSTFYISSYIFRPYRVLVNLNNVLRNRTVTRGERVMRLLSERLVKLSISTKDEQRPVT
jgi:anaerobic magnesium-protoporphyrin IX monomethyl ester cyclase